MSENITDCSKLSIPQGKHIEFDELYGDYWWVSYPIDLTVRHADRIVMQREGTGATHIGTIYKREGRFYFMPQVNKLSPKYEWDVELLAGIAVKLAELNEKPC